jgi:outer membrane receptor protein involved in Fe transport
VTPDAVVYGNISTGFEAPTLGEVRLPAGFNGDVRPQKATSVEGGVRGAAGRVSYDLAVYRMGVTDEILPETIDNVTVYRNVAKAVHTGVELSARARASRWLSLDATYAYSRFTLDEFGAFSGNRLPGIPPHVGTVRASLTGPGGWGGHAALTAASSTYVNDANSESAAAYGVISGGAGYRVGHVRFFVPGQNLTGTRYTNRVQVNDASGFYYYPAPGRHGNAGVEVRW